jgi:hypothetical protein
MFEVFAAYLLIHLVYQLHDLSSQYLHHLSADRYVFLDILHDPLSHVVQLLVEQLLLLTKLLLCLMPQPEHLCVLHGLALIEPFLHKSITYQLNPHTYIHRVELLLHTSLELHVFVLELVHLLSDGLDLLLAQLNHLRALLVLLHRQSYLVRNVQHLHVVLVAELALVHMVFV